MTELLCSVGWVLACVFFLLWLSARVSESAYRTAYEYMLTIRGDWEKLHTDTMRAANGWKALYEDAIRDRR